MATREERMRDRMRGAGRHNVGEIDFGFVIPVAEDPPIDDDIDDDDDDDNDDDDDDNVQPSSPTARRASNQQQQQSLRPIPNTSAKRKHFDSDRDVIPTLRSSPPPPSVAPSTAALDTAVPVHYQQQTSPQDEEMPDVSPQEPSPYDQSMPDAPPLSAPHQPLRSPRTHGTLSSVISRTKRLSFDPSSPVRGPGPEEYEEMVTESPADAPGSGQRRRLRLAAAGQRTTPVVGSSALLHRMLADVDRADAEAERSGQLGLETSSPIERRVATRKSEVMRRSRSRSMASGESLSAGTERRSPRLNASTAAGSEMDVNGEEGQHEEVGEEMEEGEEGEEGEEEVVEEEVEGEEVEGEDNEPGLEESDEEKELGEPEGAPDEAIEAGAEADLGATEVQTSSPPAARERESALRSQEALVEGEQEQEEAQEIDNEEEAAQRLGRKRPRRTSPAGSPELELELQEESPAVKRRRRKGELTDPAQQQEPARRTKKRARPAAEPQPPTASFRTSPRSQPKSQLRPSPARSSPSLSPQPEPEPQTKAKPRTQPAAKPPGKPKTKRKPRPKQPRKTGGDGDEEDAPEDKGSVQITVQRFTNNDIPHAKDSRDERGEVELEPIPFANASGVNAIDVLSKLCEELIEAYLGKLEEKLQGTGNDEAGRAARREHKTMYRALEAFAEVLRTRLLEHTIAVDTLHSLRKRLRAAQKKRLALREQILRVRAEREQVALRMDAVRMRHEAEREKALRHISLSTAMHDIDMAVEQGRAAPELSASEQKQAELANLELLISRVADQACSRSDGGGALKQIKEFNAFLERAAAVLERRV